MANVVKSKPAKTNGKQRAERSTSTPVVIAAKPAVEKKVSQKLLETIEKRKKNAGLFGKPPGRRGRRPKGAVEYTPENQEEDTFAVESDYEGIEYDTGIRLKHAKDDGGFAMDRFEDYDEELNFD